MMKITVTNLLETYPKIGVKLPKALSKDEFDFVAENIDLYNDDDTIKKYIDTFVSKLNEVAAKQENKKETKTTAKKKVAAGNSKKKVVPGGSSKNKATRAEKTIIVSQNVERIPVENAMIKRYVLLNGKTKTKAQILSFINALQKAIIEKRISKTSKYADIIERIQDNLVKTYNSMASTVSITIDEKTLLKYKEIGYGKAVLPSVSFIKRFIGIQGKDDVKLRAKRLKTAIEKALINKSLTTNDKYYKEVQLINEKLSSYIDKNKGIELTEAQLNGLENIAGLKRSKSPDQPTKRKIKAVPVCLNGIISSEEIAKMKFDLLKLSGKWEKLIGTPGQPFKLMIYGGPGSMKSTLAIQLSHYLASELNKKVKFIADEESLHTLSEKINRLKAQSPNLHFSKELEANLKQYEFAVIDSVNSMDISADQLEKLAERYPNISWIYIFQLTKDGKFRGTKDYEHNVDAVIKCANNMATPEKNRFGAKEAANIL